MARNNAGFPLQKKLPDGSIEQQIARISDREDSAGSSVGSTASSATRRRACSKVSPESPTATTTTATTPLTATATTSTTTATTTATFTATAVDAVTTTTVVATSSADPQQSCHEEVAEPTNKTNNNRHLLVLRSHSSTLPHRLRRDFRSFCFCCFCCCTCSCTNTFQQRNPAQRNGNQVPRTIHPSQSLKKQFLKDKTETMAEPESLPSLEEIRSWSESFDRLMKCPAGREFFREFLQCEYSEENILFWMACEELKMERNPDLVEEKARIIYEDFVSVFSPREVSLDSRVREIVNRNMVQPTAETFDEAQLQIYTLMHRDSYPRFLNSSLYRRIAQLSPPPRKTSTSVG